MLLATTQGRLATGKKVNTALDNPTNFFTAQASMTAPATSATCSTASATACRCCRPPTPASPRCRSWSIPPSRSPTRCCRRPPVIRLRLPRPADGAGRWAFTATDLTDGGHQSLSGETLSLSPPLAPRRHHHLSAVPKRQLDHAFNAALTPRQSDMDGIISTNGSITLTSTNDNASQTSHDRWRSRPTPSRSRHRYGDVHGRLPTPVADPVSQATRATWSASTTRSLRRSPPRRRTRPSTASTC